MIRLHARVGGGAAGRCVAAARREARRARNAGGRAATGTIDSDSNSNFPDLAEVNFSSSIKKSESIVKVEGDSREARRGRQSPPPRRLMTAGEELERLQQVGH